MTIFEPALPKPAHPSPNLLATLMVIPTYNEVGNIGAIVSDVLENGPLFHVLVVDDSSPDGTAAAVKLLADRFPGQVHLLERPSKGGLGSAYRAGFAWALERSYPNVGQIDADGSHPADQLCMMVAHLEAGCADVIVGSRYVRGGGVPGWPLSRRLLSTGANAYARGMLHLHQRDATAGFKVWRREALLLVEPSRTCSDGYGFQVEMSLAAQQAGVSVAEFPITFVDRAVGTSKMNRRIAFEGLAVVWRMRSAGRRRGQVVSSPMVSSGR